MPVIRYRTRDLTRLLPGTARPGDAPDGEGHRPHRRHDHPARGEPLPDPDRGDRAAHAGAVAALPPGADHPRPHGPPDRRRSRPGPTARPSAATPAAAEVAEGGQGHRRHERRGRSSSTRRRWPGRWASCSGSLDQRDASVTETAGAARAPGALAGLAARRRRRRVQRARLRGDQHGRAGHPARRHQVGDLPPRAEQGGAAAAGRSTGPSTRCSPSPRRPDATTGPAIDRLEHVVRGSVRVLAAELPFVTLLLRVRGNTEVERAALQRRREFDRVVTDLVRAAEDEGDVRPDVDPPSSAGCCSAPSTRSPSGTAPAAACRPTTSPTRWSPPRSPACGRA